MKIFRFLDQLDKNLTVQLMLVAAIVWLMTQPARGQAQKGAPKKLQGGGSFSAVDSTNIDFSETMIDGKMQAPQGFFLQGRKAQSLTQMVRLRSKWRSELRNSQSAVKSLVK
jgi:hypothetical protein